jgi:glycosyltransferase involved in cell wall biosynthesis
MALSNITFHENQPSDRMPEVFKTFDAFVVPLRKIELFKGARPSKMFEAMAAGVPIVLSVDGEAKQLIKTADAGICVEPENAEHIAEAILTLYRNRDEARRLGANGRQYVTRNYDSKQIAQAFERELLAVCAGGS